MCLSISLWTNFRLGAVHGPNSMLFLLLLQWSQNQLQKHFQPLSSTPSPSGAWQKPNPLTQIAVCNPCLHSLSQNYFLKNFYYRCFITHNNKKIPEVIILTAQVK